eukprot:13537451-Ditylum_brightwellii.AAC.1
MKYYKLQESIVTKQAEPDTENIISLAVVLGSIMASNLQIDNQSFRYVVAFPRGFFWVSFIVWLKSLRIEFAVFYVVFFTSYAVSNVCSEPPQPPGEANLAVHCKRSTSITRVTKMMLVVRGKAWDTHGKNSTALVFFGMY